MRIVVTPLGVCAGAKILQKTVNKDAAKPRNNITNPLLVIIERGLSLKEKKDFFAQPRFEKKEFVEDPYFRFGRKI